MTARKAKADVVVQKVTLPALLRAVDVDFFSDLTIHWAQKAEELYDKLVDRGEDLLNERVDMVKFMVTICAEAAAKQQRTQAIAGSAPRTVNPKPEEHELAHKSIEELEKELDS